MRPMGKPPSLPAKGVIVVDSSLCVGCRTCEVVCSLFKAGTCSPELSRIQVKADFLEIVFVPTPCLQCAEPLCMDACPTGAILLDEATGATVVEEALCIGCGECIEACGDSFAPPRLRLDAERQIVLKCDLCAGDPQCVRFCPIGAITYIVDTRGTESPDQKED